MPRRPGDAVLAVGREGHVLRRSARPEPTCAASWPEQAGPDAQLALALQGGGLGVEPADQDQVAVEAAQLLVGEVDVVVGVLDPLALRGEQLDGPSQGAGYLCVFPLPPPFLVPSPLHQGPTPRQRSAQDPTN